MGSIPREHTYWQYKCIAWMYCKSLWIKASAKCINVNVNVRPQMSVNSVYKDLYSALCCETKWMNLTIANLDFAVCLYGGSELSKHFSKCLLRMRKSRKFIDWSNILFYFFDGQKFWRQCVNVIDTAWGWIYFSMCENVGLSVQWPLVHVWDDPQCPPWKWTKESWWHCKLRKFLSHLILSKHLLMVCAHQKWI